MVSPAPPFRDAPRVTVLSIRGQPLSIKLREPFVIATGRMDATRAVLVRATIADAAGRRTTGFGEAAALPPVTTEDQPELLTAVADAAAELRGVAIASADELCAVVGAATPTSIVARAALEAAIADAWSRAMGVPLYVALGGAAPPPALFTDITLPISEPRHMASLAAHHRAAGFQCFKVKVGRDWRADGACLRAVAAAVPDARFRLDANAGFSATDALALLDDARAADLTIECYEQPCGVEDWDGMKAVTARSAVPVVADESFRGASDLDRLLAYRAAHAVNLKLVKLGGPLTTLALATRARAAGLRLMAGAMVETRVGLLAMAHVVTALGGVDWVDLDTAFLLATDPFSGGWSATGARIALTEGPGLDLEPTRLLRSHAAT